MAEYSVLIADSSEEFCRVLAEKLDGFCSVSVCRDGREALDLVRILNPEVLLADLMLPGMDGLSLLQAVGASGRRPGILVTTSYVSPYILQAAGELGASAVLQKPCTPEAAVRQICSLLHSRAPGTEDLRDRISGLLLRMGFSSKLRGYAYLREAVYCMVLDPDLSIVKELYAGIALRYGITAKLVEHGIRCAIREAWEVRDRELWGRYLGPGQLLRPTSAVLIHALAEDLRGRYLPLRRKAAGEN